MKVIQHVNALAALVLLLTVVAACGGEAPAPEPAAEAAPADGEMRTVHIEATTLGYEPERVELQAGVPARLVFTRTGDSACLAEVQSPELGVEPTELPLNEPVAITVTPQESGTFTFACGMNMYKGTIVVNS